MQTPTAGWFPTGDVATIDADGYMQITDRSKDVIKSGGEWIGSIDLENIAMAHPAVAMAACIARFHPKWDERPLLVVVKKPGAELTREELLAFFDGKIAKWWTPDDVRLRRRDSARRHRQDAEEPAARAVQGPQAADGLKARRADDRPLRPHRGTIMNRTHRTLFLAALVTAAPWVSAQTTVKDAWVRATVPQQKASGAFMRITSATGGKLVAVSSPVAGVVEIHEMSMSGNVMNMHAIPGLDLPAGKAVELKPGGYHVMMMDLKQQMKDGEVVPLTLVVEGKDGKRETIQVEAPVRALGAMKH